MTEHAIRLRAAWDCLSREGGVEVVRRVDLPTDWPIEPASPFRLRRRFGRPPTGDRVGAVRLELAGVPGLVAVRLDGRELRGSIPGTMDWSVSLDDPLPARSELVLEVDFRGLPGPPAGWGAISLVFSPGGDPSSPGLR